MMTIYHNPRCGKSRECLAFLENENEDVEIVNYLKTPLSKTELQSLLEKLALPASALVRTKEPIWIAEYKGKDLSEEQILEALLLHPILMERPIVIKGNHAVIARPLENLKKLG